MGEPAQADLWAVTLLAAYDLTPPLRAQPLGGRVSTITRCADLQHLVGWLAQHGAALQGVLTTTLV